MKVSAQYAESNLSALYPTVDSGEEVEILRPGKPALRLISVPAADEPGKRSLLNAAKGQIWMADDWDSPETNKEIEDSFASSRQ